LIRLITGEGKVKLNFQAVMDGREAEGVQGRDRKATPLAQLGESWPSWV